MNASVVYAFTLGLVGLLNPCGFPLLPAYLALFAGESRGAWPRRVARGLMAGGCLTAGFLVVFGALGLFASVATAAVIAVVPWLMLAVGLALLTVGIAAALGRTPELRLPALRFAGGTGAIAMTGFGVAYALGSLSCSLPLFLAGVSGAFVGNTALTGILAFIAYAIGMGLFATGAAVTAAVVGAGAVRVLRGATRLLPRVAGGVCALIGAYLLVYWVHELLAPTARVPLITGAQAVQSSVAAWLGAAALPVAATLGGIVVAGFVSLALISQKETSR
ncbi:MAG: hypothetical protein FWD85_04105 [Microbacteriaceae bacterium]|nr:hypothetical protein [Microbacteriaceae bacterium]